MPFRKLIPPFTLTDRLAITIVAYSKIFFRLRHNQIHRIHPLQGESQAIQMNIARYRKAVYGALWVQAALVVCHLPLIPWGDCPYERGGDARRLA